MRRGALVLLAVIAAGCFDFDALRVRRPVAPPLPDAGGDGMANADATVDAAPDASPDAPPCTYGIDPSTLACRTFQPLFWNGEGLDKLIGNTDVFSVAAGEQVVIVTRSSGEKLSVYRFTDTALSFTATL